MRKELSRFEIGYVSYYPIVNTFFVKPKTKKEEEQEKMEEKKKWTYYNTNDSLRYSKIGAINSYFFLLFIKYFFVKLFHVRKLSVLAKKIVSTPYTILKTPMAHKKWSKEQYSFCHYVITIRAIYKFTPATALTYNSATERQNPALVGYYMFCQLSEHFLNTDTNLIFFYKINFCIFFTHQLNCDGYYHTYVENERYATPSIDLEVE